MRLPSDGSHQQSGPTSGWGGGPALFGILIVLLLSSACTLWPRQDSPDRGQRQYSTVAQTPTQSATRTSKQPESDDRTPADLTANDAYAKHCSSCHRQDGNGVASAPLAYRNYVDGLGQDGMVRVISDGKRAMPAWAHSKGGPLTGPEIAGLAAFILSSATAKPPPATNAPAANSAATATARPPAAAQGTATAQAQDPPGKASYDQFCGECHPVPSPIASWTNRAAAKKYAPQLTDGQADIIVEYLRSYASKVVPSAPKGTPPPGKGPASSEVTARSAGAPPKVPHGIEGKEVLCLECHGRGVMATYPIGHTGRLVETCVLCHEPSPRPAPRVGHTLEGRTGRCLVCHGQGGGASRIPDNHSGRAESSCMLCH